MQIKEYNKEQAIEKDWLMVLKHQVSDFNEVFLCNERKIDSVYTEIISIPAVFSEIFNVIELTSL